MWVEQFIQYLRYEKNYSSHTVVAYNQDLTAFFEYTAAVFQTDDPNRIDGDMIRLWMVSQMEQGSCARTCNRKLSALKSYWRWLLRTGKATDNPTRRVLSPKVHRPLPSFLKESEIDQVLDPLPDDGSFESVRDRLMVEMLLETGMRRSELVGLKLSDIDMSRSQIRVLGKRDKERLIPFGHSLAELIGQYLKVRGEIENADSTSLFIRSTGAPVYPNMVYRLVRKDLSQVGTLSKNSPHVLRHTFATSMLNNGAELNAVKQLLGHANLSATEVYTHTTFEQLKQVYKQAHPRGEK